MAPLADPSVRYPANIQIAVTAPAIPGAPPLPSRGIDACSLVPAQNSGGSVRATWGVSVTEYNQAAATCEHEPRATHHVHAPALHARPPSSSPSCSYSMTD